MFDKLVGNFFFRYCMICFLVLINRFLNVFGDMMYLFNLKLILLFSFDLVMDFCMFLRFLFFLSIRVDIFIVIFEVLGNVYLIFFFIFWISLKCFKGYCLKKLFSKVLFVL